MDEFSQILAGARQQLLDGLLASLPKVPPGLFTVIAQDPQTLVATLLQNTVEYEMPLTFVAAPQSKVIVKSVDGALQALPLSPEAEVSSDLQDIDSELLSYAPQSNGPLSRIDKATANLEKTLRSIVRENMQPDKLLSPIDQTQAVKEVSEKVLSSIRSADFAKVPAEKLAGAVALLTLFQGKLSPVAEEAGIYAAAKIFLKAEWQNPIRDSLWQKVLQATIPEIEQQSTDKELLNPPSSVIKTVLESAGTSLPANFSDRKILFLIERAIAELSTGKPDIGLTLLVAEKSPDLATDRQAESQPVKLLQNLVKTLLSLTGDNDADIRALVSKHKGVPDRAALLEGLVSLREQERKKSPLDEEGVRKQGLAVLNKLAEPERLLSAVEQAQSRSTTQSVVVPNIFLPHPGVISVANNSSRSAIEEDDSKKKNSKEEVEGVEVTLTLPSLGEVRVNLTVHPTSGQAAVQLLVESDERKLLMDSHSHLLRNALAKVGISDSTITVKKTLPLSLPSISLDTGKLAVA